MKTRFVVYLDADKTANAFLNLNGGKTTDTLAKEVGCTREYICSAMNPNYCKKNRFSFDFATRLANSLNTTVRELQAEQSNDPAENQAPGFNYSDILNRWLSYTGMSSSALCLKSHMSINAVNRIKNGYVKLPRVTTVRALANAFSVSDQDFLSGPPKVVEQTLPYDTEVDEPAEASCDPGEECAASVEEPVAVTAAACPVPEWLDKILKEEIAEAHAGFKASTKSADKKCYASVVSMHAAFYTRPGSH